MKHIISFSVFCLIISVAMHAQEVTTASRSMVTGMQPALLITIKGADPKFVDAEWKEYMKPYGKPEKVKGSKEYVIQGIHVGDIGKGDLINVYHLSTQASEGTELTVWFSMGGDYLEASDDGYPTAVKFLKTFAHKVNVDLIAMDLEEQNKKLEKMEGALAKLQKENENLHKTISDHQARITQAEADIPINEHAQEAAKTDIDNQKAVVESVKDNPEEYKMQQKLLSKLESNQEKLVKENQSLHKTITDSNAKIKQAEMDIENNLTEQNTTQGQIDDQKKVVELVQNKLSSAKAQKIE